MDYSSTINIEKLIVTIWETSDEEWFQFGIF